MAQGRFPFWNPFSMLGRPVFGDWRVASYDENAKFLTQAPMHRYFHMAGREAMLSPYFNEFLNAIKRHPLGTIEDNFRHREFDPMMSLASVRWFVTDQKAYGHPNLRKTAEFGRYAVFENNAALPRGFFVDQVHFTQDQSKTLGTMQQTPELFRRTALVHRPLPVMKFSLPDQPPIPVNRMPDEVQWSLPKHSDDMFLVLTDNFYAGWTAEIDGKPSKIYRTNWFMQGLIVPAGSRMLRLSYFPPGLKTAKAISGVGISLLLLSFVTSGVLWWRKRNTREEPKS